MASILVLMTLVMASATALHVGVVVFPETGHLNPLLAVVEAAATRGHTTTIFGPTFFMPTCRREIASMPYARCHDIGFYNITQFDEAFMQRMVSMQFIESLAEVTKFTNDANAFIGPAVRDAIIGSNASGGESTSVGKIDVMLVDFGAWSGSAVADAFKIPVMLMWPLTLQFPTELNPGIPAIGSSLSMRMSFKDRVLNYVLQRVYLTALTLQTAPEYNRIRALIGAEPTDAFDLYYRRHILSPSIFGLDLAQPLCPNVHPVGFLNRVASTSELANDQVPEEWAQYFDSCRNGLVYINMGSVAVLPDAWLLEIEKAAVALATEGHCVVWKVTKRQMATVVNAANLAETVEGGSARRLRLTQHLPFSPRLLLAHPHTKTFVTHCGDTSVYESVHQTVPMVGIPLFADQADMCARIADANVGIVLDKFTFKGHDLRTAVNQIISTSESRKAKLKLLKAMGSGMGGATRAAEWLETVALNADILDLFYCPHVDLPWYQRHDIDVIAFTSVMVFVLLMALRLSVSVLKRCCGARRTKGKLD